MAVKIKLSTIIIILCLIGLAVCIYEIAKIYNEENRGYVIASPESEADIIKACENLTISQTAKCYIDYIKDIYKYNITDWKKYTYGKNYFFDDIKKNGGDCAVYSDLYKSIALNMGFIAEAVTIDTPGNFNHRVTIISDITGYCLIDQLNSYCVEFDLESSKGQFKDVYGKDMVGNETLYGIYNKTK